MTDLDVIAMGAGYRHKEICLYLWRFPESTLDNGLRPLQTDADIQEFLSHAVEFKFMEVYLDATPLLSLCMLGEIVVPSTAVIEEIDDGMQSDHSVPSTYDSDPVEDFSDDYNSDDNYIGEEEEDEEAADGEQDIWDGYNSEEQDGWDEVDVMEPHGDGFVVAQVEAPGTPVRDEHVRDTGEIMHMLGGSQEIMGGDEDRVDPLLVETSTQEREYNVFGYGPSKTGNKDAPIYTTRAILDELLRKSDEEGDAEEGLTQLHHDTRMMQGSGDMMVDDVENAVVEEENST